jgi:hypothetical protein
MSIPTQEKLFFSILGKARPSYFSLIFAKNKARNSSSFFFSGSREFAGFSGGQNSLQLSGSTADHSPSACFQPDLEQTVWSPMQA